MNSLFNIINFKTNTSELIKELSVKTYNFDKLFEFASANLIIPTLYNAIKDKALENYFPEEFLEALAYITNLNKERNNSILKQTQSIAQLFNTNAIDYVFLKSNALLISNQYRSVSDRMIGDIDILVSKNHIINANNLLLKEGYTSADYGFDTSFLKHRHLPRLVSKKMIAAVELHDELLSKKQAVLNANTILEHKIFVNGIPIPNQDDCIKHSVLSHQINDFGYLKWDLNYKTLYDFLVLTKDNDFKLDTKNKYFRRFLLIKQLYLKDKTVNFTFLESLKIKFLKWRLKHTKINSLYIYIVAKWYASKKLPVKLWNLFIDENYRQFTYQKTIAFLKKYLSN